MEEKELRIGNYYIGHDDQVKQWTLNDFKRLAEGEGVDEIIKSFVPINKEWLTDLGFFSMGNGGIYELHKRHYVRYRSNSPVYLEVHELTIYQHDHREEKEYVIIENEFDKIRTAKPITYVHKLQNIFFELTDIELSK